MSINSDRPDTPAYRGRIADLAQSDKPREKAIREGIRALTDAELLAIILGGGIPGKSVIDLSREILAECNNDLANLAKMSIMSMVNKFSGIGPAKAVSVAAAIQLGARCSASSDRDTSPNVRSSIDAYNYIRQYIQDLPVEEFWIIILNRANTISRAVCISRGGTSATYVETKSVIKQALDYLASGIILAHNHPSGNTNPSREDDSLTKRIKDAAAMLDINVLDHLIVTSSSYYSYSDNDRL